MTDKIELKPCPFCGGDAQMEPVKMRSGTWYGVVCRNTGNLGGTCAMEQVPSRTPEAAAGRWNMRQVMINESDHQQSQLVQLKADNERMARNRDMWKGQVERQAKDIEALRNDAQLAAKKLRSAEICHPRAVETLVGEAREALAAYLPEGWPESAMGKGEQP